MTSLSSGAMGFVVLTIIIKKFFHHSKSVLKIYSAASAISGPLREYPRRHYAWQGKHSPGVGQHGEDMVTALFSGRIQLRSLEEHIPKWLQRLDLIDSYRLNPISDTERDYEFLVKEI